MENSTDILLEPCEAYNNRYKSEFTKNATDFIDSLIKKSNINIEENRRISEQYRQKDGEAKTLGKKLSHMKTGRTLFIILAVVSAIVTVYGIYSKIVWAIAPPIFLIIVSLLLIFLVFKSKIKILTALYNDSSSEARKLSDKAYNLIAPLLDLFDSGMTAELIMKTVPEIKIDKNFNMRRYDCLSGKYGYTEQDGDDTSTTAIMSGEIIGNPYVFERKLIHSWGTQRYVGSLTIHWTTYTEVNGKRQAVHHTQVLTASVRKPKPFFNYYTDLVYGNEAAPDLFFSRTKTHAEKKSEGKLKSFIRSREKKLKALAKDNIGSGFTELGNSEFDALFGAFNRDHEVQFRLLFTPLAQKNLLNIMKGNSPYGDDFNFTKQRCINIISSDHSQNRNFNVDISSYYSYDVDICKSKFISFNEDYFRSFFFDFAPLLSIPMYQQIKPHEYIYKESYERNYTVRETEVMANRIGYKALAHPMSVTPAILKTHLVETRGDIDVVSVHALSYKRVTRVDFIPVLGGDGHFHNVPVPWFLYIPLEQETEIELKSLDMTEWEYRHSEYAVDTENHIFYHSIFTTLGNISSSIDNAPEESNQDISGYGNIKEADDEKDNISDEFDD